MSEADVNTEDEISDWEIEEGLPQREDPFIQKYYAGREALIEQEQSQRSDVSFRQSLTPIALEASSIVFRILAEERKTVWTQELQHHLAETEGINMYPGMVFHLARQTIEKTKSWEIVKDMPKGALLHAHLDATMDVAFIVERALATSGMSISAAEPLLNDDNRRKPGLVFRYRKVADVAGHVIWTANYKPQQFVPISEAADTFPNSGRDGFKSWLMSILTITPEESLRSYRGLDAIWDKFASCFEPLNSLELYEPIFRQSVQRLLHDLHADGLRWVDFRSVFASPYFVTGSETPEPDCTAFLQAWSEELDTFRKSVVGRGFWGCRFIWTCLRAWNKKQIVQHMKACIEMKLKFPDLICGFDCVGYEPAGRTLAGLTPELFWFKKRCAESGVDIPFFFHAGECLSDGDETDQNLFDALLLGTRRIGHAFSLYKHPLLMEMVKTKKILVECCPISNEILRLSSSIKSHPLPSLLARGVACSLSNDDPGILGYGTSGVTYDFWQALVGWESLGLEGLGSLAENSVRWASYTDQSAQEWRKDVGTGMHGQSVRAERMREWYQEWNRFCERIVSNYGIEYGGDL